MSEAAASQRTWLRPGAGRLIVLSGPSGVGKDTVLKALFALAPSLRYSVSYTTRPPRPGETDGLSYSFVDEPTFRRMAERKEFLEWAEVHGHLYGTSVAHVQQVLDRGEDIVLKIDVKGAAYVCRRFADAISIFLLPPSEQALRERLEARQTEDPQAIARRVADAVAELAEASFYQYQVTNDDVDHAARRILDILAASRQQPRARQAHV
ncbi:MAG: guanylate kinase [Candidatus Dormibacteria bacterium]